MANVKTIIAAHLSQRQRQINQQVERAEILAEDRLLCQIVRVAGNINVPSRPGFVWCQEYSPSDDTNPFHAFNSEVQAREGLDVWIGEGMGGRREILKWNNATIVNTADYASQKYLPVHHTDHEWPDFKPGPDVVNVYPRSLSMLRTYPGEAGALTVSASPLRYIKGNALVIFPGKNSLDISAAQPASGLARFVGIYLDPDDNILKSVNGAITGDSPAITPDSPAFPESAILSANVRLNDQTTFSEVDIVDVRQILDSSGAIDGTRVSKLVSPDGLIDPVLSVDNNGNTGIGIAAGANNQLHLLMDATKDILIDGATNERMIDIGVMRFEQTPAIENTRAVTINIDANSQPNSHAVVVNMRAAGLATGETLAAYDTVIDSVDASGGIVHAYEISVAGAGTLDEVTALHINPGVEVIHQEAGVFGNVEQAWVNDSGWTDVTAAFNATGTDVEIFSNDNAEVYWGMAAVFNAIEVNLATVASGGPGIKPVFEFSDGVGGWTVFTPVDETQGFRQIGIIDWETLVGWATDTVNGVANKYWIRITRTANSLTTPPIEDTLKVTTVAEYTWNDTGDLDVATVTIEDFLYHKGDPDTYLQFADDKFSLTAGGLLMIEATEVIGQDILDLGDVGGGGDVDISLNNGQVFIEGSSGDFGVGTISNFGSAFVEFKKDQNASSQGRITNNSDTASASALFAVGTHAGGSDNQSFNMAIFPDNSTATGPGGMAMAAWGRFRTDGGVNGFVFNVSRATGQLVFATKTIQAFRVHSSQRTLFGTLTSAPSGKVHIDQESTTAAIPVLYLDQADVSEEMVEFASTIGVGNAIEAVGAKTLTVTHFIKVTLPGGLTRYLEVGTIA